VTYQPVTTYQPAVVDQGGYVPQQTVTPGDTTYRLRWIPSGMKTNTMNTQTYYGLGGLGWVPYQSQPTVNTQWAYQPNFQQIAVPQTTMMPQVAQQQVAVPVTRMQNEVVTQQVPVQVTRVQNEVVTQQVPVQVTRMQNEVVTQQVPVQVNRMEAVVEKRQVPYSVQRPVTRVVTRKVPVTKTEWVEQKMVRPYTVQKTSVKYEKVVREVPVQVYTTERVVNKVKVSKQTPRWVAQKEVRQVLRPVVTATPMSWYDPYNAALSAGYMPLSTEVQAAKPAAKDAATDAAPEKIDIQPKAENAPEATKEQEAKKASVPEQILPAPAEPKASEGLKLNGAEPEAAEDAKISGDKDI
jgi:hypothetical protein